MGEQLLPAKHSRGCHCKKTGCLKKYCECFQGNSFCSEICKCIECKNNESCEERRALCHGDTTSNLKHAQLGSNAVLSGTNGSGGFSLPSPNKKRKSSEIHFGQAAEHVSCQTAQDAQASTSKNTSSTSLSESTHNEAPDFGNPSSKIIYRSLLADVVQPDTVKGLCKLLVIASREVANACGGQTSPENGSLEKQAVKGCDVASNKESCVSSSKNENTDECIGDDRLESGKGEKVIPGASLCTGAEAAKCDSGDDGHKQRAMSLGTLALMCDEHNSLFTDPSSPSGCCGRPWSNPTSQCFAEQERVILSEFRDCLKTIIDVGKARAMQYSTEAAMSMKTNLQ